MKIYTKTGDSGQTSLYDGSRCSKADDIFMSLGEIDELSSRIGMLCSMLKNILGKYSVSNILRNLMVGNNTVFECHTILLRNIQRHLQDFNSHIATLNKENKKLPALENEWILDLEICIDDMEKDLPKLTKFILPGVTEIDSQSHLCRTQTRKAERMIILLSEKYPEHIPIEISKYMNRLSDYFFVLSRWICYQLGNTDFLL